MSPSEEMNKVAALCRDGAGEADDAVGQHQRVQAMAEALLREIQGLHAESSEPAGRPVLGKAALAAASASVAKDELAGLPGNRARAEALAEKIEAVPNAITTTADEALNEAEAAVTEVINTLLPKSAGVYGMASRVLNEAAGEAGAV